MKWLYLAAGVVVFGAGYAFADALRTADIQRLKADYAQAAQEYQAKLTKREADNAKKLADAVDKKQAEIDALGSQLAGMRDDVERLRRAASACSGGVPPGAGSACLSCERQVADCKRLLAEGAELLIEGGGLVGGLSADRNAVRKALKP
jgi:HAMP domain-containing protein